MTTIEKLKQHEEWLVNNPDHPDHHLVWQNKEILQELQTQSSNE